MSVRKVLIASQKSGVGATTTAVNLAAAAAQAGGRILLLDADPLGCLSVMLEAPQRGRRRELRQLGVPLPGALWAGVLPGLDLLAPYEEGLSSDEDLEALLEGLETAAEAAAYHCVLLDSPPFLGERPRHLLRHCDEFLMVLRAEPMAFRTLPLLLNQLPIIEQEDGGVVLRGILLTQPVAGTWETDLRRYLGRRALPQTIPVDEAVVRAAAQGCPLVVGQYPSAAASQYQELMQFLELHRPVVRVERRLVPAAAAPAAAERLSATESRRRAAGSKPPLPSPASVRPAAAGRPPERPARRRRKGLRPWHVWVGAGMLSGTVLGSVRSPEYVLSCAVGIVTTAGVALAMQWLTSSSGSNTPPRQRTSA
jgi:chromosome partitioning protein